MVNSRVNWKRCSRAVILDSMMMDCFQLSERKGLLKKNSKLKVVPKKFARCGRLNLARGARNSEGTKWKERQERRFKLEAPKIASVSSPLHFVPEVTS